MNPSRVRTFTALLAAVALVATACGGGGGDKADDKDGDRTKAADVVAQVASYDLVANRDQRFIVGLVENGTSNVLRYGTVELEFFYLGTKEQPLTQPRPGPKATATFLPIPGQKLGDRDAPELGAASKGAGVYAARPVRFDTAGFWGVHVDTRLGGRAVQAKTAFEVHDTPSVPFPGDKAPRTANPVAGAPGAVPSELDSRARGGEPIPDAELHSISIADALSAGKPLMVVVSTPVYCVSKFCGPITDTVSALAKKYGDKMSFAHLEVWKDFESKAVNPSAAEWINPKGGDAQEPWVFLVGADGVIVERWDNVAGDAELEAAVEKAVAPPP